MVVVEWGCFNWAFTAPLITRVYLADVPNLAAVHSFLCMGPSEQFHMQKEYIT